MPIVIITILCTLFFKHEILEKNFGKTYLKLVSISILGLLTSKTFLFIQWYWFIALNIEIYKVI